MKTFLKITLRSVTLLFVLAICLLVYTQIGNLSIHKDRILTFASEATGYEITAEGRLDLDIGKKISLSVGGVRIANPGWPDDGTLASLGTFRVVVDTWSILSGPLEIDVLEIGDGDISLKENDDGTTNWIASTATDGGTESEPPGPDPVLHQLSLENLRVDHTAADGTRFRNETATLRLSRTGANEYDYDLIAKVGEAELDTSMTATGSLRFAASFTDFTDVRVDFDEAGLSRSGDSAIDASFTGFATADLSADKPAIDVDIDMTHLSIASGDEEQPAAPDDASESELLFDTAPLTYSWLDALDLVADINIADASLNGNALSEVHVATKIKDSALTVTPIEFKLGNGGFLATLELAATNDIYALKVEANVDNIRLAQLADEDQDPATVPPLTATLILAGQGASLHDIMASSNGKLSGRQDSGQLNLQAMGALFSDFLTSIVSTVNPLAEARTYATLECGIFEIDITDGIADIEEFALQSDRLTLVSSGNVDFGTEALDLTLSTKSREGLGLSVGGVANSFIKVGGTLKDPSIGMDAAGSVTTAGAAVATGGLSILAKSLWDRVSSEIDICASPDTQSND